MLKVARGTQSLIDLEDADPDVLHEHLPGSPVPFWRQIRSSMSFVFDELDHQVRHVPAPPPKRGETVRELTRAFMPVRSDSAFAREAADVVYFVDGGTVLRDGARLRNWLVDDFARATQPEPILLQWRRLSRNLDLGPYGSAYSLASLSTRSAVYARALRRDPSAQVERLVDEFLRLLGSPFDESRVAEIKRAAVYHERVRPFLDDGFSRLMDRLRPRVVVMQSAAYGAWCSLIAIMKSRGITVAEPQHGWIGPTHAAYNFGRAAFSEHFRESFPDELLTFGPYWEEGLKFPGRLVTIGKPAIESAVTKARGRPPRREVLIVSSTTDPEEMNAFVRDLRARTDASRPIRFRPHPSERPVLEDRYGALRSLPGVEFDLALDVYESLSRAAVVIGIASTVLFEAKAFGCEVLVRESPSNDYYVGGLFGEPYGGPDAARAMAERINRLEDQTDVGDPGIERDTMWAPDSLGRFRSWVASRVNP